MYGPWFLMSWWFLVMLVPALWASWDYLKKGGEISEDIGRVFEAEQRVVSGRPFDDG